jgi:hypothetical protein
MSAEEIDKDLSKAAQLALDAIKDKDYHGIFALKADEIIDLGLAIYGPGDPIKVVFAAASPTKRPSTKSQLKPKKKSPRKALDKS